MGRYEVSQRRAAMAARFHRSSLRHQSQRDPLTALRQRMRELAQSRVRFGYRRLLVLLRREGWGDRRRLTVLVDQKMGIRHCDDFSPLECTNRGCGERSRSTKLDSPRPVSIRLSPRRCYGSFHVARVFSTRLRQRAGRQRFIRTVDVNASSKHPAGRARSILAPSSDRPGVKRSRCTTPKTLLVPISLT
jgi:hypothetical protein